MQQQFVRLIERLLFMVLRVSIDNVRTHPLEPAEELMIPFAWPPPYVGAQGAVKNGVGSRVRLPQLRAETATRRHRPLVVAELADVAAKAAAAAAAAAAAETAYWDSTAPSALDFALSGPGVAALALVFATLGGVFAAYADVGPRRDRFASRDVYLESSYFYLRITVSKPLTVELPSGTVAELAAHDETVLREFKLETIDALARTILTAAGRAGASCSYEVYRAKGETLVLVRRFPRSVDADGAAGWIEAENANPDDDKDARWDEYSRLGSVGLLEKEWSRVIKNLGGVERSTPEMRAQNECKLCGGEGQKRCGRCFGMGGCPECLNGKVACEWCNGSGQAN
jgi:hypothetical protein